MQKTMVTPANSESQTAYADLSQRAVANFTTKVTNYTDGDTAVKVTRFWSSIPLAIRVCVLVNSEIRRINHFRHSRQAITPRDAGVLRVTSRTSYLEKTAFKTPPLTRTKRDVQEPSTSRSYSITCSTSSVQRPSKSSTRTRHRRTICVTTALIAARQPTTTQAPTRHTRMFRPSTKARTHVFYTRFPNFFHSSRRPTV